MENCDTTFDNPIRCTERKGKEGTPEAFSPPQDCSCFQKECLAKHFLAAMCIALVRKKKDKKQKTHTLRLKHWL